MTGHRPVRFLPVLMLWAGAAGLSGCELAAGSWQAQQRETWTRDYTVEPGGRFELANTNGQITLTPSPDGVLHVRAEKVARGASDAAARDALKEMEIVEQVERGVVSLRTRRPSSGLFGRHGHVEYTVQVPETMAVKVENSNGRIEIGALAGPVDVETTNGGIQGRGLSGTVRADTTNGGVDLELASVAEGGVDVSTTNGGVRLALPATARADISARCTNGGINTTGLNLETLESSRRKLEARLNGGGPRVRAETTNGGIRFSGGAGAS